jgi:hypothetical protein
VQEKENTTTCIIISPSVAFEQAVEIEELIICALDTEVSGQA